MSDKLDFDLITALRSNGRRANKVLAQTLGVAESTVTQRIKQLRNDKVMRVTLRRDLFSKGYNFQCFADIWVKGRDVSAVADDLAEIPALSSVSMMLGSPEIIAVFNAIDRVDLHRVLQREIPSVRGVNRIELHTAVDIRKYQAGYSNLRAKQ